MLLPLVMLLAHAAIRPAQDDAFEPNATPIELPEGPAKSVWSGVTAGTEPAAIPAEWSVLLGVEPWAKPETWRLWARVLGQEARASAPDPARRAALAMLAARQGRSDAAWAHFTAIGASSQWAAAAMPGLLPGVTQPAGPGGLPRALPADALLEPCLPPASIDPETGSIVWTRVAARNIEIGGAKIALVLALEPSGLEIDVEHLSGPPVRLFVRMPAPPGFAITIEYVDWIRQETHGEPLEVNLVPGGEPIALWGRFEEQSEDLPAIRPGPLPAQVREGGLWLVLGEKDSRDAALEEFARLSAELLAVEVRIVERAPDVAEAWTGTVLRVPRERRAAWLARLAGALEAYLLGDPLALGGPSGPR